MPQIYKIPLYYFLKFVTKSYFVVGFEQSTASGCVCVCGGDSSVDDGINVGSPLGMASNTHHMSNQLNTHTCMYVLKSACLTCEWADAGV